jgi:hypothetical protein
MKKFLVHISSHDYGSWEITAPNADEAWDIADKRLEDGDASWMNHSHGETEINDVVEYVTTPAITSPNHHSYGLEKIARRLGWGCSACQPR